MANKPEDKIRDAANYFGYEGITFFSDILRTEVQNSYWMLGQFQHEFQHYINFMWLGFINKESFEYGGMVIGTKPYVVNGGDYNAFIQNAQYAAILEEIRVKARAISKADALTIVSEDGSEAPKELFESSISIAPYTANLSFNYIYPGTQDGYSFNRAGDTYHKIIADNGETVYKTVQMAKVYAQMKDNFFGVE